MDRVRRVKSALAAFTVLSLLLTAGCGGGPKQVIKVNADTSQRVTVTMLMPLPYQGTGTLSSVNALSDAIAQTAMQKLNCDFKLVTYTGSGAAASASFPDWCQAYDDYAAAGNFDIVVAYY